MDDLIDRQAAIDAVETKIKKWNAVDGEGYHVGLGLRYTDVIEILTELPSAQPEQRWIPMKERRPEKDGRYLCTFQGKAVHICMYLNGCFRICGYNEDKLITAWTPLPEPYEGGNDV